MSTQGSSSSYAAPGLSLNKTPNSFSSRLMDVYSGALMYVEYEYFFTT